MERFFDFTFRNCCLWKKKLLDRVRIIIKTITGALPLSWQDGIGGNLVDYKIKGKSEQYITKDDTDYVIPSGITVKEYIENASGAKVSTGVVPASLECEYYCKFYCADTGSLYLMQSRYSSGQIWGISGSQSGGTITFIINGTTVTSSITRTVGHTYEVTASCDSDGEMWLNVVDLTTGDGATNSATVSGLGSPTAEISLFTNASDQSVGVGNRVYEAYYKEDGAYKFYLVPTEDSNGNVGMRDLISASQETTTGTFTAGNNATVSYRGCGDKTENLFDKSNIATGYRLSPYLNVNYGTQGESTSCDFYPDSSYYCSHLIPVNVGETFVKSSPTQDAYHRFKIYNANKVSVRINNTNSITIGDGEAYIAVCGLQAELDTTMVAKTILPSAYTPYGYAHDFLMATGGCVDLGSLAWTYSAPTTSYPYGTFASYELTNKAAGTSNIYVNGYSAGIGSSDKRVWGNNSYGNIIVMVDSRYSDAASFKAAMSGVMLYYQRTTDESFSVTNYTAYTDEQLFSLYEGAEVDLGDGTYSKLANKFYSTSFNSMFSSNDRLQIAGYTKCTATDLPDKGYMFVSGDAFYIRDDSCADGAALKSKLTGITAYYWASGQNAPVWDELSYTGGEVLNTGHKDAGDITWLADGTSTSGAYVYYCVCANEDIEPISNAIHLGGFTTVALPTEWEDLTDGQIGINTDKTLIVLATSQATTAAELTELLDGCLLLYQITATTKAVSMPAITDLTGYHHFDYEGTTKPSSAEVKYNSRSISV